MGLGLLICEKSEYSDLSNVKQEGDISLTFTPEALLVPAAVHY